MVKSTRKYKPVDAAKSLVKMLANASVDKVRQAYEH